MIEAMTRLVPLSLAVVFCLATGCHRSPEPPPANAGGQQTAEQPAELQPPLCEGEPCPAPKQCLSYLGIAGPSGPTFHACELPCEGGADNDGCPDAMRCVTIADGPGDVCRPAT